MIEWCLKPREDISSHIMAITSFSRCLWFLSDYTPTRSLGISTFRSFPHLWLITGFVTRVTRRVPLVEQELHTLPQHLNSHLVFRGVHVTRSLFLCVILCKSLFFLLYFFFWPLCCLFLDFRIWLPLWYLQTRHWNSSPQVDLRLHPYGPSPHQGKTKCGQSSPNYLKNSTHFLH